MKFTVATCFTCSANVRTGLVPWMLRFAGAKLNLSSGMASAAGTSSRSIVLIGGSISEVRVGAGGGEVWAWGAGEPLGAAGLPCATAATLKQSTRDSEKIRT